MSEIGNGYSWFKFDIEGWLSSPDILAMTAAEEGYYIRLISTQARDGKLPAKIEDIAKKCGRDPRGLKKWFKKWGFLFPIINLTPSAYVTILDRPCNNHAPNPQRCCNKCVTSVQQVCGIHAAAWMQGGSNRANPKLWNLSIESGKSRGLPLLEENRRDLEETRLDHTNVKLTFKGD